MKPPASMGVKTGEIAVLLKRRQHPASGGNGMVEEIIEQWYPRRTGGSCRSVGSTPEVWRIAAPTKSSPRFWNLRLKATSVYAKNHRRWDDPSSDGLH